MTNRQPQPEELLAPEPEPNTYNLYAQARDNYERAPSPATALALLVMLERHYGRDWQAVPGLPVFTIAATAEPAYPWPGGLEPGELADRENDSRWSEGGRE